MTKSFNDFVSKRSNLTPGLKDRASRDRFAALIFLRPLSLLPLGCFSARGRRFIFLSARTPDLLRRFSGHEAVIVGTLPELKLSLKTAIPYCFIGDLYAASHALLFGRRFIPERIIIRRWVRFLSRQQNPCYLVIPNDTNPIALLLTKIANECTNIRVVCIQHGLFNAGFSEDDIEGRNSDFNLVYDHVQQAEMARRLPHALIEVMGFPAELSTLPAESSMDRTVVLVGTGMVEHPALYQRSLEIFKLVAEQLASVGLRTEYRPHPTELSSPEAYARIGVAINRENKPRLFGGSRKLFIGFTSTLLYEAELFGHAVIVLDDEIVPGYSISPLGVRLSTDQLAVLPGHATNLFSRPAKQGEVSGLRSRFEDALLRAEARFSKSGVRPSDKPGA